MFSSIRIPKTSITNVNRRAIVWDALLSAGCVLLVGLTFHYYHTYEPSHGHATLVSFSPTDADRRIADAKSELSGHAEDIHAWTELAIGYYQKGPDAYVDGLNALEKAESLGSTDESLFFYAGVMYDGVGLPEYAVNEFKKYLRIYPDNYEALVHLANVYFHMEKYDDADALYRQVVQQWPKDPTVWFNYAVVCIKKGRLDDAQAALTRVRDMAGKLPPGGYFQEGELARLKGNEPTALQFYKQELEQQPADLASLQAAELMERHEKNYKEANDLQKKISDLKHSKSNG